MQVKPVSPPNGSELLVLNKDGRTLYVTRPQVVAILASTGVRSKPMRSVLTEKTGQERYRAIQGGVLVEFSLADFTAYLAGTATPDPVPFGRGLDVYSGTERFVGRQGTGVFASDIMQTMYVRGLGGSLAGLGGDVNNGDGPTGPVSLSISGPSLLSAIIGSSNAYTASINGGTGPYVTTVSAGSLPAGRSLTGAATANPSITGTYTTAATSSYTLRVTDSIGATATLSVGPVVVSAAPATLTISGTQSTATVGDTTVFTPTITGGTAPYTLSLASGTMAPGRGISGLSVTGTFTTAGTYSYTLRVTDSVGATATLAVGPLVVSAAAAAVERIAAYGTSVPLIASNRKGGRLQRCTRKTIVIGADVPYITGTFDNYATQPSGDTAVGASVTILQHAVINPDGSRSKIVTFDNGASTTKLLGTDVATGIRIFHDKVYPADVFGPSATMFRRGDRIMLQTDALVSNDQTAADMCYNCEVAPYGDSSIEFDATGVAIAPGVGTITPQTNQTTSGIGWTVSCVYGPHNDTAHINFGDSISAGTGDSPVSPIRLGYSRAAANSYQANSVPMLNLARHGTTMNDMFNTDLSPKATGMLRMAYLVAGTFQQVSENWAANDLGQTPAQSTLDLTTANKLRLWQILRNRGVERITSVAPTPRTSSGTVNTPVNSGWARGGFADQLNQFLEDQLTAGTINTVIRSLALRGSTDRTNDNYFIYKTTDFTVDGTHFQALGYLAVIPEHRAAVLRGNTANDEPANTIGQVALDTFTTGVGGSVADRATDSGSTWLRQGTANLIVTAEGRAYASVNGYLTLRDSRIGRHQYIERDNVIVTATTGVQNLQTRRLPAPDVFGGYNVSFNPATLVVAISRVPTSGTSTTLATATLTDGAGLYSNVGSQYTIRMESNGPYHSVYMGPKGGPLTLAVQATDATYMLGEVGVRENNNAGATTGRHIDEVRAGNLTPVVL